MEAIKMTPQRIYEDSVSEIYAESENPKMPEFFGKKEWDKVVECYADKMRKLGYGWLEICKLSKNIDCSDKFKAALSLFLLEKSPPPEQARMARCLFEEKVKRDNGILKDESVVEVWHGKRSGKIVAEIAPAGYHLLARIDVDVEIERNFDEGWDRSSGSLKVDIGIDKIYAITLYEDEIDNAFDLCDGGNFIASFVETWLEDNVEEKMLFEASLKNLAAS